MAYFAKIDDNNVVTKVLAVANDAIVDESGTEQESIGKALLSSLHNDDSQWVQTSFNHNFRKKFATPGDTYDSVNDVFIYPQPFPSWVLDNNFDWQAPKPLTNAQEGQTYIWSEENLDWVASI